jgi:FKBP-type peptidyl-prolyl cis-trans isomerase FkpA
MRLIATLAFLILSFSLFAQDYRIQKVDAKKYTKLNDVVQYTIIKSGKGTGPNIKDTDLVFMHMIQQCGDTVMASTYRDLGKGIYSKIRQDERIDDYSKVLFQLKAGDSAIVKFTPDSVLKQGKPPFYKDGDELKVSVKIVRIVGKKELDSLEADAEKQEAEAKKQEELAKLEHQKFLQSLVPKEDSVILDYCKSHNITGIKKATNGSYYKILEQGKGPYPINGKEVSVIYRGQYLTDSTFDVNQNKEKPFKFTLGNGMVIKGWDESIPMFNVGTKALIILPSRLAYGDRGFNGVIPENIILKYELEVLTAQQ